MNFSMSVNGGNMTTHMYSKNGTEYNKMSMKGDGYEWSMNYTGKMMNMSNMSNMTNKTNMSKEDMIRKKRGEMKEEMMEYRVKFDKYFEYGMDTQNMKAGSMTKQCSKSKDCNGRYFNNMCCVSAVMTNKVTNKQDSMYRCMNSRLAQANLQMSMDNMKVSMRCIDSGAMYMTTAFLASMVSIVLFLF